MNTTRHTPPERLGLRLPWETETGRTGPCPCGAACAPRDRARLCWYSDKSRLPKRRSAQCTQGRLRSSSETSSTYYIVRNIPRSGDMPSAKCRKSTQDVRKNAQHPRGAAANSRPTGTQDASPSQHALYVLESLAACKSRMQCGAGGEGIARENAKERTVHDARRAPSPRTAARHSALGLFLLHLVEKALQDEADDHDDYDRDYDRNRPTWHHNATPFRLFARRPSPKPTGALHPCDIKPYYRAFTRRATAPRARR